MAEEAQGGGEKTEAPTPKKLEDSSKKGDVLQSRDLGGAMIIFVGTIAFLMFGGLLFKALTDMVALALVIHPEDIEAFDVGGRSAALVSSIVPEFMSLFILLLVAAVATPAVLGSLGFRWSAMGGSILYLHFDQMAQLAAQDLDKAIESFASLFLKLLIGICVSMMLIAMIDVPIQLFQRSKRLKMTKQEIKDEYKESEGSPDVRALQRQRRSEMLNDSTRKAVAEATVVFVNPTHFAVALRYDRDQDMAPVVLGKGCDAIALAMREMAGEIGKPVMEYPDLTRSIYYTSDVGDVIDERLYAAVAMILSFLIQLDAKLVSPIHKPKISLPDDVRYSVDGERMA